MSGGQMQRVAIARALVNDPDILLADEPTGALDSETSLQIMELLKNIAKNKLVIMVTHNPELAQAYSTRIVRLLDGRIISDTNPYEGDTGVSTPKTHRKISMSLFTALSLSFNNLRTKLGRTLLTAFAGSIGIIGIALILSLSAGIQNYIDGIQRDTLTSYPISILQQESGLASILSAQAQAEEMPEQERQENTVYVDNRMYELFNAAFTGRDVVNNLKDFKVYLDQEMQPGSETGLADLVTTIQYQYQVPMNTYVPDETGRFRSTELSMGMESQEDNPMAAMMSSRMGSMGLWSEILPGTNGELISPMVHSQYQLLAGRWPEKAEELVLVVSQNGSITDVAFYALGLMRDQEANEILAAVAAGKEIEVKQRSVTYEEILEIPFRLVKNSDYYTKNADGSWRDVRSDEASLELVVENGIPLKIVGILTPDPEASSHSISGTFGYTAALTELVIRQSNESEIVKQQRLPENENLDVTNGLPFVITEELDPTDAHKANAIKEYFASCNELKKTELYTAILSTPSQEYLDQAVAPILEQYSQRDAMVQLVAETYGLDPTAAEGYLSEYTDQELQDLLRQQLEQMVTEKYAEQAQARVLQIKASAYTPEDPLGAQGYAAVAAAFDALIVSVTDERILAAYYDAYMPSRISGSTLADTLEKLGAVDYDTPSTINIYPKTFEDKARIDAIITRYNDAVPEEDQISYTDYVALLMSGVTTMIDAVSYGLIAFVSISLVVSSIMIGIITYISVLERTKEIGILRSVGASKKDISRVFNAETTIIGLASGLLGIGVTAGLNIPICIILKNLTGIGGIATLPLNAALILVGISVCLTLIAGLIPARLAAKKDPVIALRTE
jgi:putative ABC transport system permease protein